MLKYVHIKITYVVQIFNQQKNLKAFNKLIETYSNYSNDILNSIHFVFVDDCSPVSIKLSKNCKLNYTLARVLTDITWNQGGARNLGVHLSKSQKLILTDLDHIFSEDTFKYLLNFPIPDDIFVFRRLENGKETVSHYNTFFCSKTVFFKSLGIDEEFCGNYGHEDVFFLAMQRRLGTKLLKFKKHPISFVEHKKTKNPQHHLVRDEEATRCLFDAKMAIINNTKRDPFDAHSRLYLNFEWKIIEEKISLF